MKMSITQAVLFTLKSEGSDSCLRIRPWFTDQGWLLDSKFEELEQVRFRCSWFLNFDCWIEIESSHWDESHWAGTRGTKSVGLRTTFLDLGFSNLWNIGNINRTMHHFETLKVHSEKLSVQVRVPQKSTASDKFFSLLKIDDASSMNW